MLPKPPYNHIPPNHARLHARKGMTIVIGMIAEDGIVIAADREEGTEHLKNDTGKIYGAFRGTEPHGWISIGGAGSGPECDEISALLANRFCSQEERTSDEMRAALTVEHRSYYQNIVLPFASATQIGCPDYSLVVGCLTGQTGKYLFSTSKLAVNTANDYDAIGIGAQVANIWLTRLYERMPTIAAAKLAAYVIYQVKNSVTGCGLGTDIVVMNGRPFLPRVPSNVIRKWEDSFRYFPILERTIFSYCVGLKPSPTQYKGRPLRSRVGWLPQPTERSALNG